MLQNLKSMSQKSIIANCSLRLINAPTNKAVGSEYVIKIGTDGFSRRTSKTEVAQTIFEIASFYCFCGRNKLRIITT